MDLLRSAILLVLLSCSFSTSRADEEMQFDPSLFSLESGNAAHYPPRSRSSIRLSHVLYHLEKLHIGHIFHPSLLSQFCLLNMAAVCDVFNCLKGKCVSSSSFPFYRCECDSGWKNPLDQSWLPCFLPNCTISDACASTSPSPAPAAAPAVYPSTGIFNVCSYSVCGKGQCTGNSTSSYECKCDPGYSNLLNKSDGYCLRECSLGADCSNLNISFGGVGSPPPPSPVSSNQNTSQGTSSSPSLPPASPKETTSSQGPRQVSFQTELMMVTAVTLVVLWT